MASLGQQLLAPCKILARPKVRVIVVLVCHFCVNVGALQDACPSTGRCCCLYCCYVSVLLLVPYKMLAHPKVGVVVYIVVDFILKKYEIYRVSQKKVHNRIF